MNQNNSGFLNSIPPITKNIIIINLLCWIAQMLMLKNGIDLAQILGLNFYKSEHFMPHQFFTYMFMHSTESFSHVFFNMFAVFMFGRTLEIAWGAKRFLFFYVICGLGAALAQEIVWSVEFRDLLANPDMPVKIGEKIISSNQFFNMLITVGASGSVFGILLGFGMYFPNTQLYIIPFPFPIKAKWFVIGYGVVELFMGVANFSFDRVAHFAHLGGLVTGLLIILIWRKTAKTNGRVYR